MKKKPTPPQIPCDCCRGTGRQPLPTKLMTVLEFLREHPECTTDEIHTATSKLLASRTGPTATNARLVKLERLGFAERSGYLGKSICWRARPPRRGQI